MLLSFIIFIFAGVKMLVEIKIIILLLPLVQLLPDGAPMSVCKSMKPSFRKGSYESNDLEGHLKLAINIRPNQGRPRTPPYYIRLDRQNYTSSASVGIKIVANQTQGHVYFKGLLLQARKALCKTVSGFIVEKNAVGSFLLESSNGTMGNSLKYLNCFSRERSAVTHISRNWKHSERLFWIAPTSSIGHIVFQYVS